MTLDSIDMLDLIPPYMQDDLSVKGLCAAGNYILSKLHESILKMDFIQNLDLLEESDLDYIAKSNNIIWYNESDSKSVKLDVIKNSEQVFWTLGTTCAIESVITDIFGAGEVSEWYEYGGAPYMMKVTTKAVLNEENLNKAAFIISKVKRAQAQIDGFHKLQTTSVKRYFGSGRVTTKQIIIKRSVT